MPLPNGLPIEVTPLVEELRSEMKSVLGEDLVGLYLYGSLVTGDFDLGASDVDLLAVTALPIDDATFARLDQVHRETAERNPAWVDRLEIAYVPARALRTFRTEGSTIAVISPGEPFHRKEAGNDWTINWYVVRTQGQAIEGPAPGEMIAPISREEYAHAVRTQALEWWDWVDQMRSRPAQAYAILTLCRALYSVRHGEQASKLRASRWAEEAMPEWASVIQDARRWRDAWRERDVEAEASFPRTKQFVQAAIDRISTM